MINRDRGKIVGATGVMALLASWGVFWVPRSPLARRWDPWLVLLAIVLSLGAVVPGIIAARTTSKWWYALAGAGFLSAAVLLAGLAV